VSKYADPIDDAREGLSVSEAEDIAAEDASLIYCRTVKTRAHLRYRPDASAVSITLPDYVGTSLLAALHRLAANVIEATSDLGTAVSVDRLNLALVVEVTAAHSMDEVDVHLARLMDCMTIDSRRAS